jgi:peptide/nickel transport system substrate-binding protein
MPCNRAAAETLNVQGAPMCKLRRIKTRWIWLLAFGTAIGCSSKKGTEPAASKESAAEVKSATGADARRGATNVPAAASASENEQAQKQFVLGDLLEPFTPPPLEEIDRKAEWIDRPVLDSIELMRQHQQAQGAPKLSVLQALALRNDSRENNQLISATMGRLPPADGRGVDYDAEIVLVADGDLKTTNPLLASTVVDGDFYTLAGFGLFSFDWNLSKFAMKEHVVSWQTSKDRLIDKVVMRGDLTWSDGTPITAYDVEFTFQAIMSDAVTVWAVRQGTDQIRHVKAYDDHTLVYFHKQALATNDGNMNFPVFAKHIYEKTLAADPSMTRSPEHSRLEDNPVAGGPYKLLKRTRGQEFVLERREDYYMHGGKQVRMKPYFKTVRYKVIEDRNTALLALKAGRVDSQMLLAEQWNAQTSGDDFYERNTKIFGEEWTGFQFMWNLKTPYFEDKRVRWAMAYAFDYDEMLKTIYQGLYEQSRGEFHPGSWMYPKNPPPAIKQDLNKAEDLLDEAGWKDSDGDGIRDKRIDGRLVPFEFTLHCVNFEDRVRLCTLMKECLDKIGVICHVKPTEFTVLTQLNEEHKFQAAFGGWSTGADPDTQTNIWYTGEPRNYGQYSNPEVDKLFVQARKEFDKEKRGELYGRIHNLLWEDQPYTWLYNRNGFYGFNKKLRGYNFSPRGPFHYSPGFSSIYITTAAP